MPLYPAPPPGVGYTQTVLSSVPTQANTTWSNFVVSITADYFKQRLQSSGAQNDSAEWDVFLPAGVYDLSLLHSKDANRGIYTITVGGTVIGTADGYGTVADERWLSLFTGLVVAPGGKVRVKFQMLTKNGASVGYYGVINAFIFHRTA